MKSYLFYRHSAIRQKQIDELSANLRILHNKENALELVDMNTPSGQLLASAHSVVAEPTVLITFDDGREIRRWDGHIPLVSELSFYLK